MTRYNPNVKHVLDRILALAALAVLSPLLLAIGVFVRLDSPGPALFVQKRIGKNLRPFKLYKFRTMTCQPPRAQCQFDPGDANRVTRTGAFLRRAKLDELPELYNILKGDMSIVGPRPEVPRYVAMFSEEFRRVLRVRPGLSDFASIKYRNEESILAGQENPEAHYREVILPDKLRMAREYAERITFSTDYKVLTGTIREIFR